HHDYGAGVAAAGGFQSERANVEFIAGGFYQLFVELRLRRHLLEQSSPHAACHQENQWRRAVGELAFAVLAFAVSVYHGVDGEDMALGTPSALGAHGGLWIRAPDGGDRLLYFAM